MARANKSAKRHILAQEKRAKAIELRKRGASYTKIAEILECSRSVAHDAVWTELRAAAKETGETAEEVRLLELERLDSMLLALSVGIRKGDPRAITTGLSIHQRICILRGIEPSKIITVDVLLGHDAWKDTRAKTVAALDGWYNRLVALFEDKGAVELQDVLAIGGPAQAVESALLGEEQVVLALPESETAQ